MNSLDKTIPWTPVTDSGIYIFRHILGVEAFDKCNIGEIVLSEAWKFG